MSKQSPDFKADMEAFEGTLLALSAELKEEAATAEACLILFFCKRMAELACLL